MPILYGSNYLSYSNPTAYWAFIDVAGRYFDLITHVNLSLVPERSHDWSVSIRDRASPTFLLCGLANQKASSPEYRIDVGPEEASLIQIVQKKVLVDGPQFHFFLPSLARESIEKKLRGGVDNNRVEIHWRSDESYSPTRLATMKAKRFLWDEECLHPGSRSYIDRVF